MPGKMAPEGREGIDSLTENGGRIRGAKKQQQEKTGHLRQREVHRTRK